MKAFIDEGNRLVSKIWDRLHTELAKKMVWVSLGVVVYRWAESMLALPCLSVNKMRVFPS